MDDIDSLNKSTPIFSKMELFDKFEEHDLFMLNDDFKRDLVNINMRINCIFYTYQFTSLKIVNFVSCRIITFLQVSMYQKRSKLKDKVF